MGRVLLSCWLLAALAGSGHAAEPPTERRGQGEAALARHNYLIFSPEQISALPDEGPAWEYVVECARQDLSPHPEDQDSYAAAHTFAAAIVAVRTGDKRIRARAIAALQALPAASDHPEMRVLSLGRQLAGWVLAADLLDYREPEFVAWVDQIRTREIGGHGRWTAITQCHEESANNWATNAGAGRLAASVYLGDEADVQRCLQVLRGWLGDRESWPGLSQEVWRHNGFRATNAFNAAWLCGNSTPDYWRPINYAPGHPLDGAIVDDVNRGGLPNLAGGGPIPEEKGLMYSWGAYQSVMLQCLIAERHGFAEVWEFEDRAMLRALDFIYRNGGFGVQHMYSNNYHIAHVVNAKYGTNYPTASALRGRSFGYTDWLYGPAQ